MLVATNTSFVATKVLILVGAPANDKKQALILTQAEVKTSMKNTADVLIKHRPEEHKQPLFLSSSLIIIMYIYHALINALNTHMIHINLNMILYTQVEHSPSKTTHTKHHTERQPPKNKNKKQQQTNPQWI